jgi:serine protease Do
VRQVNGMGTGIVIDSRGYILTNYHVVEGVSNIQVSLSDGTAAIGPPGRTTPRRTWP